MRGIGTSIRDLYKTVGGSYEHPKAMRLVRRNDAGGCARFVQVLLFRMHASTGEQDADGSQFRQAYGAGSDGVEGRDGSTMNTPEENEQQWQRVAGVEESGMVVMSEFDELARERDTWRDNYQVLLDDAVEMRGKLFLAKMEHDLRKFERDQFEAQLKQLQADFDRRTDVLNEHIAREKVLEDALTVIVSVYSLSKKVSARDLKLLSIAKQAIAAKEPTALLSPVNDKLPDGCHCSPGNCMAPIIMGFQTPCRDPQKAAGERK